MAGRGASSPAVQAVPAIMSMLPSDHRHAAHGNQHDPREHVQRKRLNRQQSGDHHEAGQQLQDFHVDKLNILVVYSGGGWLRQSAMIALIIDLTS